MIVGSEGTEPGVTSSERQAAVEQVLNSQTLARSDQLKAFLEFVCAQEMKGEGANLSEYLIGVQVLGKPEGYSTADDATVRTRAHALRRKLADYYLLENPGAAVRVELPKGTYCPQFARVPQGTLLAAPTRRRFAGWALGVGTSLASLAAGYLLGQRKSPPEVPHVLREAWGPLLRQDGNVLVCIATPFHVLILPAPPDAESRRYRPIPDSPEILAWYKERQELPADSRLFMNSGHNSPMFGDVAATISAIRLLERAGVPHEVMPERVTGPFALRNRNVILFGRPDYSRAAKLILDKGWFGFGFHRPANGSAIWQPNPASGQPEFYVEGGHHFGLITVTPSDGDDAGAHRTIVVSGTNSAGVHAAAEFLTSAPKMEQLLRRFQTEGGSGWPRAWQAVVKTNSEAMLPFDVTYHAHRVLIR
ncbi:MAG: hypothetical protein JNL98_00955 [Bryobacterales bacterium]|nr:hypothetical protein [Bryobacterales bacterium]